MGNPKKGTPQYTAKLNVNKAVKAKKRQQAFLALPKVQALLRKARRTAADKMKHEREHMSLELSKAICRSNKHYREKYAYSAAIKETTKAKEALEKKVEKMSQEHKSDRLRIEQLEADLASANKEVKRMTTELGRWSLFWSWVKPIPGRALWHGCKGYGSVGHGVRLTVVGAAGSS